MEAVLKNMGKMRARIGSNFYQGKVEIYYSRWRREPAETFWVRLISKSEDPSRGVAGHGVRNWVAIRWEETI